MSAIRQAIQEAGSQSLLAALIGVTQATVAEWATGRRPIPPDRCPDIERAVEGAVSCEDLRDDVRWARVADERWPWHPEGRPLIDVAKLAA